MSNFTPSNTKVWFITGCATGLGTLAETVLARIIRKTASLAPSVLEIKLLEDKY